MRTRERVYRFYVWHIRTRGYSPTYGEVAEAVGVSPSMVSRHVSTLAAAGLLAYHPRHFWRGVVLPEEGSAA